MLNTNIYDFRSNTGRLQHDVNVFTSLSMETKWNCKKKVRIQTGQKGDKANVLNRNRCSQVWTMIRFRDLFPLVFVHSPNCASDMPLH